MQTYLNRAGRYQALWTKLANHTPLTPMKQYLRWRRAADLYTQFLLDGSSKDDHAFWLVFGVRAGVTYEPLAHGRGRPKSQLTQKRLDKIHQTIDQLTVVAAAEQGLIETAT